MADYLEIARRYTAELEVRELERLCAVSAISAESPNPEQGRSAHEYVNTVAGARVVELPDKGGFAIAVWPERRGQELDLALKTLQLDHLTLLDREC